MPAIGLGVSQFFRLQRNTGGGGGTPTSSNSIVQTWLNKIGSDGLTYPSQAQVNIYTTAWDYADAEGLTAKFALFGLTKVDNKPLCTIPFIHSAGAASRFTLTEPLDFTSYDSLRSDGGKLASGWIPNTHGGAIYTLDNAGLFLYSSNMTSVDAAALMGDGAPFATKDMITPNLFGSDTGMVGLNADGLSTNNFNVITNGLFLLYRVDAVNISVKINGSTDTQPLASVALGDAEINLFDVDGFAVNMTNEIQVFGACSGDIDYTKLSTFINLLLL